MRQSRMQKNPIQRNSSNKNVCTASGKNDILKNDLLCKPLEQSRMFTRKEKKPFKVKQYICNRNGRLNVSLSVGKHNKKRLRTNHRKKCKKSLKNNRKFFPFKRLRFKEKFIYCKPTRMPNVEKEKRFKKINDEEPRHKDNLNESESEEDIENQHFFRICLGQFQQMRSSGASTSKQRDNEYVGIKNSIDENFDERELLELQEWGRSGLVSLPEMKADNKRRENFEKRNEIQSVPSFSRNAFVKFELTRKECKRIIFNGEF